MKRVLKLLKCQISQSLQQNQVEQQEVHWRAWEKEMVILIKIEFLAGV